MPLDPVEGRPSDRMSMVSAAGIFSSGGCINGTNVTSGFLISPHVWWEVGVHRWTLSCPSPRLVVAAHHRGGHGGGYCTTCNHAIAAILGTGGPGDGSGCYHEGDVWGVSQSAGGAVISVVCRLRCPRICVGLIWSGWWFRIVGTLMQVHSLLHRSLQQRGRSG